MKKLNVVFPEKQILSISDMSDAIDTNSSIIARAALALGINQLKELAARSPEKAKELAIITDAKAKF